MLEKVVTVNKYFVVFTVMLFGVSACKRRASDSMLRAQSQSSDVDVKTVMTSLADISGLLLKHTYMGEPLLDQVADPSNSKTENDQPIPAKCDPALWRSDTRWSSPAIVRLSSYAVPMSDLRVRTAAVETIVTIAQKTGLVCAEEMTSALITRMRSGSGYCNTFSECSLVVSLLGSLIQVAPNVLEVESALKDVLKTVTNNSGGVNSRAILQFKIKSYMAQYKFYNETKLLDLAAAGYNVTLSMSQIQSLKNSFKELEDFASDKLFVVNQMRDILNISPELVKKMITQDMLDGVDFATLQPEVQDMFLNEALGLFDSAWQMQLYDRSLDLYIDRLAQNDPEPWLKSIKAAARKWSADNDSFDVDSFSLANNGTSQFDSVHPKIAFLALANFSTREAKLPWRRQWSQSLTDIHELIPTDARDLNIESNFLKTVREGAEYRAALLASLKGRGLVNDDENQEGLTKDDLRKAEQARIELERMVNFLLDDESEVAAYFSQFESVYAEFVQLYEKIGNRMVVIQSVIQKLEVQSPSEDERDQIFESMDQATVSVLDQWLKIRCLDALYRSKTNPQLDTHLKEAFFLDTSVNIDFQCRPETSGETRTNVGELRTRIGAYTGNITYKRGVDRSLTKVKEAAAMSAMLIIGLPAGLGGNVAAAGAKYLLVQAAKASALQFLRKQMVRSLVAGAIGLYVNVTIFNKLHGVADRLMDKALGIEHREMAGESWGQYIYHTAQGMAVFASLHHVSRFSLAASKRLLGGAAAGSRELSTYLNSYKSILKTTWKEQAGAFALGTTAETTFFFAMPYASEYIGTNVFQVYEGMSPDDKILQRLYSPSWSENLKQSFATALLFRTFGLLGGRGNMRENPDYVRFRESAREAMTGTVTREQALMILGLASNAPKESIAAAHRKLAFKYHPDRTQAKVQATLESKLPENKDGAKILMTGASSNRPFEQVAKEIGLTSSQMTQIEPLYRQLHEQVSMFKRVQASYDLLKS